MNEETPLYVSPRPVLLASRARSAAWPMTCDLCPYAIVTGERFADLPGGRAAHLPCIAAAAEQAVETEGVEPGARP